MSKAQALLDRLPSHFEKEPGSNNHKAFSLAAKNSDDLNLTYDDILRMWDVEQAEGDALDALGRDEGIPRGSYDDDTYRKLIQVQYIVNMSEGDIESMNAILRAYMGDDFISIEEGYNSVFEEPASFVINISRNTKAIPHDLVRRVKPVGVKANYAAGAEPTHLILRFKGYSFPVYYPITNMFRTADVPGYLGKGSINLTNRSYDFGVSYPITNTFYPTGNTLMARNPLSFRASAGVAGRLTYLRAGEHTTGEATL